MAGDYDNTNTGAFGKNEKMREGRRDPEVTGNLREVECPHCQRKSDWWLSAWKKERREDGQPFYSVSIKPKDAPREDRRDDRRDSRRDDRRDSRPDDRRGDRRDDRDRGGGRSKDYDDDIPF